MENIIAIFDIGKTNKKLLLFNYKAELVHQQEEKFPVIKDEDGIECDDIDRIERWIFESLQELARHPHYDLKGVNFSTYGASLAFIGKNGERLCPIYNYLKPVSGKYTKYLFQKYGGQENFCRQTASPALDNLLNSGIQMLWLKEEYPEIFQKTKHILHFPQYLSYFLTKKPVSEYTSIGCHTYLWDFDKMEYHQWLANEGFYLPVPVSNSSITEIDVNGKKISIGVGIHDSSASLVPYFQGYNEKFLLLSTGTWCINMNPFNYTPLNISELNNDCLCYLSINQKPVKSSRLFMGHIHDIYTEWLCDQFNVSRDKYKHITHNESLFKRLWETKDKYSLKDYLKVGTLDKNINLNMFSSFEEAYYQMMFDLTELCVDSIKLILEPNHAIKSIFVAGGFSRNTLFINILSEHFPNLDIFTTEIDNSSALGAALVIMEKVMPEYKPEIKLGLKKWSK